jgi:hypothetical protein
MGDAQSLFGKIWDRHVFAILEMAGRLFTSTANRCMTLAVDRLLPMQPARPATQALRAMIDDPRRHKCAVC